jgi:hypothetical protein
MERITTTMDEETLSEIRRIAGKRGVSRFLHEAAKERLASLNTLALLDELDERYGKPSEALRVEVDADMRAFFGMPRGKPSGRNSRAARLTASATRRRSKKVSDKRRR